MNFILSTFNFYLQNWHKNKSTRKKNLESSSIVISQQSKVWSSLIVHLLLLILPKDENEDDFAVMSVYDMFKVPMSVVSIELIEVRINISLMNCSLLYRVIIFIVNFHQTSCCIIHHQVSVVSFLMWVPCPMST